MMKWIVNQIKYGCRNPVLLVYGIYCYVSLLDESLLDLGKFMQLVRWGTLLFLLYALFVAFVRDKRSFKTIILCALVIMFFTAASIATKRQYVMIYALFIMLCAGAEKEDIFRTSFLCVGAAVVTIFLLCRIGVITDYIYYGTGSDAQRNAHCYGFTYYSKMPFILFYCLLVYLCLRREKMNLIEYAGILLLNWFIYRQTTLRLTYYLTIFVVAAALLLRWWRRLNLNRKPVLFLAGIGFSAGTLVTYFIMRLYDSSNAFWNRLPGTIYSRIRLMSEGYHIYGVRLLGSYIKMAGNSALGNPETYFYIDSGFAYSLLGYGLIFTVVVVILYTVLFRYSCYVNDKYLFIYIVAVLIFTMINNTWVTLNYNPVLLFSLPALEYLQAHRKKHGEEAECLRAGGVLIHAAAEP